MEQYIPKSALVAEIRKRFDEYSNSILKHYDACQEAKAQELGKILIILDTLEVKEVVEPKQPEYGRFEYRYGVKPRWNIGDTLANYEFYTDREGEYVFGKVTKVDFDEEDCDWFYTFEDGSVCSEQSLLEEETYKKN